MEKFQAPHLYRGRERSIQWSEMLVVICSWTATNSGLSSLYRPCNFEKFRAFAECKQTEVWKPNWHNMRQHGWCEEKYRARTSLRNQSRCLFSLIISSSRLANIVLVRYDWSISCLVLSWEILPVQIDSSVCGCRWNLMEPHAQTLLFSIFPL